MNICFNNIRIINPTDTTDGFFNLHIKDGIIANIFQNETGNFQNETGNFQNETGNFQNKTGNFQNETGNFQNETGIDPAVTEIIDGTGMIACPGLIDIHTHLREPGFIHKETFRTGTESAANGGFTEIVCMPNTNPAIDNVILLENILNKTRNYLTKVHISAAITQNREGKLLTNLHSLKESGALYFTDDGNCVTSAAVMKNVLEYIADKDYLIAQHCEEHSLTEGFAMNESNISMKLGLIGYPNIAEEIIIERDIRLLQYYAPKSKYHIQHISTSGAVNIVKEAKNRNLKVTCEVTPHHLWFTDEKIEDYDANYKMNPPLRQQNDINSLIEGLKNGTIDCIASDHAPHSAEECEVEFEKAPNGIIGLETSLGAILTLLHHKHNFPINEIINLMSINPRRVTGIQPIIIKANEKANLTIFSPNKEWIVNKSKFKTLASNTPFNKMTFKGKPEYTFNNNQVYKCDL